MRRARRADVLFADDTTQIAHCQAHSLQSPGEDIYLNQLRWIMWIVPVCLSRVSGYIHIKTVRGRWRGLRFACLSLWFCWGFLFWNYPRWKERWRERRRRGLVKVPSTSTLSSTSKLPLLFMTFYFLLTAHCHATTQLFGNARRAGLPSHFNLDPTRQVVPL